MNLNNFISNTSKKYRCTTHAFFKSNFEKTRTNAYVLCVVLYSVAFAYTVLFRGFTCIYFYYYNIILPIVKIMLLSLNRIYYYLKNPGLDLNLTDKKKPDPAPTPGKTAPVLDPG